MKKLLVWFHPKGENKDYLAGFVSKMAVKLDAEVFAFDAPIPYKNGFMWYGKHEDQKIAVSEFNQSADYALEKIGVEIERRGISFKDVIFAGNSQGGFMAAYFGLTYGADRVIMLCSDVPYEYEFAGGLHKDVPIYWVEGAKDEFLSDDRKASFEILQDMGCNMKYILNEESTHNGLDLSILDEL